MKRMKRFGSIKQGGPDWGVHMMPNKDEQLEKIAHWIREMPDLDPPEGFSSSVMEAVYAKKPPKPTAWRRFRNWATSPVNFTVTPLRLSQGFALVVAVVAAVTLWRTDRPVEHPDMAEQMSEVPVVFELSQPGAHSVSVIGTFNQWEAGGYEMKPAGNGEVWTLQLKLPEGRHEYAYLIDGEKLVPDPNALLFEDDGFGNRNAVLILGKARENLM